MTGSHPLVAMTAAGSESKIKLLDLFYHLRFEGQPTHGVLLCVNCDSLYNDGME